MNPTTNYNLKIENLKKIYKYIKGNPGANKSKIASEVGLSFSSVSNLSTMLEKRGLISCLNNVQYTGGRKASALISNVNYCYALVVDLHWTDRCTLGIINLNGEIIRTQRFFISDNDTIEMIMEKILAEYNSLPERILDSIEGVIIGVSAVCDKNDHMQRISSNPNFNNIDFCGIFRQYIDKDIILVENDANLASLSQVNNEDRNLLFVLVTQGVGLGIIINGRVYGGYNGYAGELGHFKVKGVEKECKCGHRGCLRTVVTLSSIAEDLGEVELFDSFRDKVNYAENLRARYLSNEIGVRKRLEMMVNALAQTFSILFDIFNPKVISVGGDLWPLFGIIKTKVIQLTRKSSKVATITDVKLRFVEDSSCNLILRGGFKLFFSNWLNSKFPLLFD